MLKLLYLYLLTRIVTASASALPDVRALLGGGEEARVVAPLEDGRVVRAQGREQRPGERQSLRATSIDFSCDHPRTLN